jgi:hypothetical protein
MAPTWIIPQWDLTEGTPVCPQLFALNYCLPSTTVGPQLLFALNYCSPSTVCPQLILGGTWTEGEFKGCAMWCCYLKDMKEEAALAACKAEPAAKEAFFRALLRSFFHLMLHSVFDEAVQRHGVVFVQDLAGVYCLPVSTVCLSQLFALNCLPSTVCPQLFALNCLPSTVCLSQLTGPVRSVFRPHDQHGQKLQAD